MNAAFDQRKKAASILKLQRVESTLQGEEETGHVHKIISFHLHLLLGHREKSNYFQTHRTLMHLLLIRTKDISVC